MQKTRVALIEAIKHNDFNEVRYLIAKGVNINVQDQYGTTALMRAVEQRHLTLIQYLVQYRVNINTQDVDGNTALMWAVCHRDIGAVEYLMEHGADIHIQNVYGKTACMCAVESNSYDMIKSLLKTQNNNLEIYLAHPHKKLRNIVKNIIKDEYKKDDGESIDAIYI